MTEIKLALVGNPNIGKSSLFNQLTGLNQRVGNYPGITVDKKTGVYQSRDQKFIIHDLPGIYSLYPNSQDEEVVHEILLNKNHKDFPDAIIAVVDATNLKRSLLVFEQLSDLGFHMVMVVNMKDEAEKKNLQINRELLEQYYKLPVIFTNARTGEGMNELYDILNDWSVAVEARIHFDPPSHLMPAVQEVKDQLAIPITYVAWQYLAQHQLDFIESKEVSQLDAIRKKHQVIFKRLQVEETLTRYKHLDQLVNKVVSHIEHPQKTITEKLDRWTMHPFWGYFIFTAILFLIFQLIFTVSDYPMGWIEDGIAAASKGIKNLMPVGPLAGFIADGIIPGIGGILVFVPQILILFACLLLLEESGYMSRVVYLMDRLMRPFGLNGKSVVPLISGAACAIPAIMSARNIENKKERLITILVTPFMTCSARLPVYTLLISVVIPDQSWGIFGLRGLVLLLMYLLGLLSALIGGWIFHRFIKSNYKSYLIMEIPGYKLPMWGSYFTSLYQKIKSFVWGAGKIILAISIILWVLSFFGPGSEMKDAEIIVKKNTESLHLNQDELNSKIASYKLEHSYLGLFGKAIEPAVQPLGYDWKIGIGIISSFAAREVFVPTMASIYSISNANDKEAQNRYLIK